MDSAVARLVPDATLAARITDAAAFDRVLMRAFSHAAQAPRQRVEGPARRSEIGACGIDPGVRPGEVTPEAYIELARRLA